VTSMDTADREAAERVDRTKARVAAFFAKPSPLAEPQVTPIVPQVTLTEPQVTPAEPCNSVYTPSGLALEPECWAWPVPETPTFADERAAYLFLRHWNYVCAIGGHACAAYRWKSGLHRLVEDHDHDTGLTRGFLCNAHNSLEGWGSCHPPVVKYRERPPAAILGIVHRYSGRTRSLRQDNIPVTAPSGRAARQRSRRRLPRVGLRGPPGLFRGGDLRAPRPVLRAAGHAARSARCSSSCAPMYSV
jgi:hypothetical protein